jgi:hypothetical protein
MNANDILLKLSEWKEKILLGIVLIATLMISMKASPLSSGGIVNIDAETRQAAIQAAGATPEQAERALNQLERPTEITPTPPDQAQINRPYFDERDVYRSGRQSAWSLTQATYTSLPPIELEVPGMTSLPDFDTPAGPRPELSRLTGFIPRDGRRVVLREEQAPGFED